MKYYPNIQLLLDKTGESRASLARLLGKDRAVVTNLFKGERQLSSEEARLIAKRFNVSLEFVMGDKTIRRIPVLGHVGASFEVIPIDDYPLIRSRGAMSEHFRDDDPVEYVDAPVGAEGLDLACLKIKGDSMPPFEPGWLVFYTRHADNADSLLNKLVIARLTSGAMCIKKLIRGGGYGKFSLLGYDNKIAENVSLEWVAKVHSIQQD